MNLVVRSGKEEFEEFFQTWPLGHVAGQDTKSVRGMPWNWEPKKDATSCEKPRGAANKH